MKIWISPYELNFKRSVGEKKPGFLIKVQKKEFKAGYADYSPWPQFGDLNVEQAIRAIKYGDYSSPLLKKSIEFACKDGLAREKQESLLLSQKKLRNNKTLWVQDFEKSQILAWKESGFRTLKLKVGKDFSSEKSCIDKILSTSDSLSLRLDFNTQMSSSWEGYLQEIRERIEYIEDPYNEASLWNSFSDKNVVKIAYDQPELSKDSVSWDCEVIKLAKQYPVKKAHQKTVYTSYMDHPLGLVHTYCQALEEASEEWDHGFLTLDWFEAIPFNDRIIEQGPCLEIEKGWGIGFDDILEDISWQSISY